MGQSMNIANCYDGLLPKHYPLMGREEAEEFILNLQHSARMVAQEGEIRLDKNLDRLVRMIESVWVDIQDEHGEVKCRSSTSYWLCEDLITERRYQIKIFEWSYALSDMEALALAARND